MITVQSLKQALPATSKLTVNQSLVDQLNAVTSDPLLAEHIRNNFVTYNTVMQEGKYTAEEYVNAITYCTYKIMGLTNKDAYINTFPQRHQQLVARGASAKDISAYVAAYHKGKLVMAILDQAHIPMWLLNQDAYQKAINVQADLMKNAQSELVRTQAANSILTHLAKPKDAVPQVAIQINQNTGMNELLDTLAALAEKQVNMIDHGVTAKELAAQKLGKRVD
jgi:hypothetical protein